MNVVVVLLMVLGMIAAGDELYFHQWRLGLRGHRWARTELVTHVGHGLASIVFSALCLVEVGGTWVWLAVAAVVLQGINQVADTWQETRSRGAGIPHWEYLGHHVLALLWGAIFALVLAHTLPRMSLPTEIAWRSEPLPWWLAPGPWFGMAGAVLLATWNGYCAWRLGDHSAPRLARETASSTYLR